MSISKNFKKDEVSIEQVLLIIIINIKKIIALTIVIVFISVLYIQFIAEPIYLSTSKITSSSNSSSSTASNLAAQFGVTVPNFSDEQKWDYPSLINSSILLKSILEKKYEIVPGKDKLSLIEYYFSEKKRREFDSNTLMVLGTEKIRKSIQIDEDLISGILTINVRSKILKLSRDINLAIIEELDAHLNDFNKRKTSKARLFIENRIIETRKELEDAEENLKTFKDRNRRIENSPSLQLVENRLAREVQVLIGVYTSLKQQLENTKIEEVKDSDYIIIIDPPLLPIIHESPRKKRFVILVFSFAFMSFCVFFTIIEHFNNSRSFHSLKKRFYKELKIL